MTADVRTDADLERPIEPVDDHEVATGLDVAVP